jgi:hypothetical protein
MMRAPEARVNEFHLSWPNAAVQHLRNRRFGPYLRSLRTKRRRHQAEAAAVKKKGNIW